MKRIIALMLSGIMVLAITGCDSTTTSETSSSTETQGNSEVGDVEDLQTVTIGVAVSDPTNSEVIQLMDYLNYLASELPLEFKFSEAIESPEDEMTFIENCAMSGCQGIIGQYTDNAATAIEKCAEFEMYYTGSAENSDIYDVYIENQYYLGGITWGQGDYDALYEMGNYLTELGCRKIVYANGGADFGVQIFADRQDGFKAAIEEAGLDYEETVITVSGFPGDSFYSAQQAALSEEGVDAVCASFNGVDYWVTPMETNGLTETVPLVSYGSLNEAYVEAMEKGSLSVLAAVNVQKYGIEAALIFNAVNGDAAALKEDGVSATNMAVGVWLFTDAEDAKKVYEIQENERIFTAEDIASLCTAINPEASAATIQELIDGSSIEQLLAK